MGDRARTAKNRQLEIDAAEIRVRAERRLGEMLTVQKQTVGMNQGAVKGKTGSKAAPLLDTRPTLSAAGIDKKLSASSQKLAAMPAEKFEAKVSSVREAHKSTIV